jgi:hypothetical protein
MTFVQIAKVENIEPHRSAAFSIGRFSFAPLDSFYQPELRGLEWLMAPIPIGLLTQSPGVSYANLPWNAAGGEPGNYTMSPGPSTFTGRPDAVLHHFRGHWSAASNVRR